MTRFYSYFKSTVLLWFLIGLSCGNTSEKNKEASATLNALSTTAPLGPVVAAHRTEAYFPTLRGKRLGIVANQTSVIFTEDGPVHLVDSLLAAGIQVKKVFAPEHGFRGEADAGEKVTDGVDTQTGLPIISLYGKNRKPTQAHLEGLDMVVFDIQDVGVRFYTYIATLQLVMEACAEKGIPVMVLDRPNPNAHYIDGPTMEAQHAGFLGMTQIPLVYGMTLGEYAAMINGEGWLSQGAKVQLTVIELRNWTHKTPYTLPIRPSPNLPNDRAITLYPSLGLFEGTHINAGRGTESQFQRYGASFLDSTQYDFTYVPMPNFGSKEPKENGKKCFGKDLSQGPMMQEVSLRWLMDAYANSKDKDQFFITAGFTKHAGTEQLQQQIVSGLSEVEIKATWQPHLERFKQIRSKYLKYE